MSPEQLLKIDVIDKQVVGENSDDTKADAKDPHKDGWKLRADVLSDMYNHTTKEKRICKKCNHSNPFFKLECEECS